MKRVFLLVFLPPFLHAIAQNNPFPMSIDFDGVIKPNNLTQNGLNSDVQTFYDYWKGKYLKTANTGGYYIEGDATGGTGKGTSEGHGYGMIITCLMAGYDANAQQYYDGLYTFFDNHRSTINNELMGWLVDFSEASNTYSSAADGDLDIAYSLILAHYQWGSDGNINYLQEARDMINGGVRTELVNNSTYRVMLGDWDNNSQTSRSSDWMLSHFRAFKEITSDASWDNVVSRVQTDVNYLYNNYSSSTGLMPDFINGNPAYPDANSIENNGQYYFWNACRTPWRISQDYIHYGNSELVPVMNAFVDWAESDIGTNFWSYGTGYTLTGSTLGSRSGPTAYVAPLVVAATLDGSNQNFVNAGWSYMADSRVNYFNDAINMLCMLLVSGNWWVPDGETSCTDCQVFCKPGLSETALNDDFDEGSAPWTPIGGIYPWGEDELAGDDNPNFQALLTRDSVNGQLDIQLSQGEGEYNPFGFSFGTQNEDGTGDPFTVNVDGNSDFEIEFTNNSAVAVNVGVTFGDILNNNLNTYSTATDFATAWQHQMQIVINPGQTRLLTGTLTGAYYANYDNSTLENDFDYENLKDILITVTSTENSGEPNWAPLALSSVDLSINYIRMGDCSTITDLKSQGDELQALQFYPNPVEDVLHLMGSKVENIQLFDALGKEVHSFLETESGLLVAGLPTGVYWIKNTSTGAQTSFFKQ